MAHEKGKAATVRTKKAEWAWEHMTEVYRERDLLVRALSKQFPSHLSDYSNKRTDRKVVCIHTPAGQLAWTIPTEMHELYTHLEHKPNDWDKHKTADRFKRLAAL